MSDSTQNSQDKSIRVVIESGETAVYTVGADSNLVFGFDSDSVLIEQRGNDLVILGDDGGTAVLKGYVSLVEAGTPPDVLLNDGILVAGDVFLMSQGQPEETAADGVVSGSGLNGYFDDAGGLVGGDNFGFDAGDGGLDGSGEAIQFFAARDTELFLVNQAVNETDSAPTGGATDGSGPDVEVPSYDYPEIAPAPAFGRAGALDSDHFLLRPADVDENDPEPWTIRGNPFGHDEFNGGAGNDMLNGMGGNDIIYGNDGDDVIAGSFGDDILYGGHGNDQLGGQQGNNTIYGGGGYDSISAGGGSNVIVLNEETFSQGQAIVEVKDFEFANDGFKLEDGVEFEALRQFGVDGAPDTYVEAVLGNGTDNNVIVRLMGMERADFDAALDSLPDSHVFADDEQLLQYMSGNDSAWV
ncbi:MAG: hypothetical protein CL942_06600 [Desulfovibrio sp.]|nr:hypothetical protein [Desulfovibrio sp.]|tara:strand:- start:19568 stop:20803 length:1236 start_codon:yes stop_codon:yes gene_type:complete